MKRSILALALVAGLGTAATVGTEQQTTPTAQLGYMVGTFLRQPVEPWMDLGAYIATRISPRLYLVGAY